MNATEKHIKDAETQMIDLVRANFTVLLEKIKGNVDFLDAMNATNTTHDPGADDAVAYEAPPSIPTAEDLANATPMNPPVEELKKRLDLEPETPTEPKPETPKFQQDLSWELVQTEDERYGKIVAWLINGATKEQLENAQKTKAIRFDAKAFDHLRNLVWYREELLKGKAGAFDLKSILSQAETTEEEKVLWKALANEKNLK